MAHTHRSSTSSRRAAPLRRKSRRAASEKFEVTLPPRDARLIRDVVDRLRAGGAKAEKVRILLAEDRKPPAMIARTTKELYSLIRRSPLVGLDIGGGRSRELPRDVDLF